MDDDRSPWPDDPLLREAAVALQDAGHFAWIVDRAWRAVFMTREGSSNASTRAMPQRWASTSTVSATPGSVS